MEFPIVNDDRVITANEENQRNKHRRLAKRLLDQRQNEFKLKSQLLDKLIINILSKQGVELAEIDLVNKIKRLIQPTISFSFKENLNKTFFAIRKRDEIYKQNEINKINALKAIYPNLDLNQIDITQLPLPACRQHAVKLNWVQIAKHPERLAISFMSPN